MNENKNMFFVFLFNVLMKTDILIPDLYFYNIKIQTNIKQNLVEKYVEKSQIFENYFGLRGIAVIAHHPYQVWYVYLGKYGKTRNSCLLSVEKMEWELPSRILVTRNPNWSQRSRTETGCVKGRY